jgi:hypothetical protein
MKNVCNNILALTFFFFGVCLKTKVCILCIFCYLSIFYVTKINTYVRIIILCASQIIKLIPGGMIYHISNFKNINYWDAHIYNCVCVIIFTKYYIYIKMRLYYSSYYFLTLINLMNIYILFTGSKILFKLMSKN